MQLGLPKELKADEYRVGLTPVACAALVRQGHSVHVETGAGAGSGFSDSEYREAGCLLSDADTVWETADVVVKVKEPLPEEYSRFRPGLSLFTYLHLAAAPELTRALQTSQVTAIAYETVTTRAGNLPLLTPMSEIAGRMAPQIGAHFLEKEAGGKGLLLAGAPGVAPGRISILGGGVVGSNAARIAMGLGAEVTLLEIHPGRIRQLDDAFQGRVRILMASEANIGDAVRASDLVIGAVLIPGARAPRLVSRDMVRAMQAGSVIVDVAVDQGGSIATIDRVTTHTHPTYLVDGVVHYAVANMPGAVPRTATWALGNSTWGYVERIANRGVEHALRQDAELRAGLNVYRGHLTNAGVAAAFGQPLADAGELLGMSRESESGGH